MSIKITSDSTCDLSPEIIKRYDIDLFSLYITMGGKTYRDGIDIFQDDIFRHVEEGGDISTTASLAPAVYEERFRELLKDHESIIHIDIGDKFSSSYANACMAAEKLENVYVVNSNNLSSGHGIVVLEAALMAEKNMKPVEIVDKLNDLSKRVRTSFVLDRLDYMRKGGRCSMVVELGANLLRLKPRISVINGKMGVTKKYRGSFEKCIKAYIHDQLDDRDDLILDRIFVTHPHASEEVVELAKQTIKECADFKEIIETRAGCTVSCHCGPNTLGVLFVTK